MKLSSLLAAITIMALSTTACGSLRDSSGKRISASAEKTAAETADTLGSNKAIQALQGEWSIVEVLGQKVVINGEDHPKLTLSPTIGGMIDVIGFNGCNYLNGTWNLRGDKIIPAGEMLSSLRACPDAPYEYMVNQALAQVDSYKIIDSSNVSLLSTDGTVVMQLRKRGLAFLNGAWKVTAIDGQPVSAKIRVVIDVDEGRIHGNAGCNLLNGEITANLDKGDGIEFHNLATSRMTCPDIATEQAFLLALENVDTASKGETADYAVLRNSAGQAVIALTRLSQAELARGDE